MSSRSHVPIPASILIRILLRKYAIEIRAPTRTALFTLILPGPPLLSSKGQQILSHSFLFPAFQESALSQQADKKSRLFQVFRFADSRQFFDVQIYFNADS